MTGDPQQQAVERAMDAYRAARSSPDVRAAVRRAVTDGWSVALAGVTEPRLAVLREQLVAGTRGAGPGPGRASLWFSGEYLPVGQAAMLNGAAIHAYDFDDTHDEAIVHCMAAVLPAAVVGAESGATDGPTLLAAVAAGTELACNLAMAKGHYAGWHYTTLCGTMGAALAWALAAGADVERCADAVGNAYVFAAGNKQAVLDSSLMKRLMPGFATHNGVLAGQAAVAGLGGVRNWLTGEFGLFRLFYDDDVRPGQLAGGERFRIEELSYKPYPACRFTHGAIECALRLRERLGRAVPAGSPVTVRYPALDRFGIVCRPYRRRGVGVMDAQFSTAYLVAAALLRGAVTFESYAPVALEDPGVGELAAAVTVTCDLPPAAGGLGPIEVSVGGVSERVETVLGSPERPLDSGQVAGKFDACAARFRAGGGSGGSGAGGGSGIGRDWLTAMVQGLEDGGVSASRLAALLSFAATRTPHSPGERGNAEA